MRTDEDTDRQLRAWFLNGPTRAHDRVLEGLGARLARQPQRAGLALDWRITVPQLRILMFAAGGAAAILVAALALWMRPVEPLPVVAEPSISPPPTATPVPSAEPPVASPMPAGTHRSSQFPIRVTYTVPDGW